MTFGAYSRAPFACRPRGAVQPGHRPRPRRERMARRARAPRYCSSRLHKAHRRSAARRDGVATVFAASDGAAGTRAAPTDGGEPQDTELGNAALRSPLRTPLDRGRATRTCPPRAPAGARSRAARPPDARTASGRRICRRRRRRRTPRRRPSSGIPSVGETGVGTVGGRRCGRRQRGQCARRCERARRPAGRAVLPADRARRRSIEAARPEISLKAGMARPEALSAIPRDTR